MGFGLFFFILFLWLLSGRSKDDGERVPWGKMLLVSFLIGMFSGRNSEHKD
jgi:uncharacterized membrane protein YfcA